MLPNYVLKSKYFIWYFLEEENEKCNNDESIFGNHKKKASRDGEWIRIFSDTVGFLLINFVNGAFPQPIVWRNINYSHKRPFPL